MTTNKLERVCLLLADLSGYTAYLANAEPDHAPALAGDLVETVVRELRPTFRLAKLEGDAAFLVAPLSDLDGPMLLDAIDATYDSFRRRMESVAGATTCDCASCSRVPDLDLKFVVHAGSVVRHRVAGREELTGTDAIIVHRLLKADSPSAAGLIRYALLTDAWCKRSRSMPPASAPYQQSSDSSTSVRCRFTCSISTIAPPSWDGPGHPHDAPHWPRLSCTCPHRQWQSGNN